MCNPIIIFSYTTICIPTSLFVFSWLHGSLRKLIYTNYKNLKFKEKKYTHSNIYTLLIQNKYNIKILYLNNKYKTVKMAL